MAKIHFRGVKAEEAIEHIRRKLQVPTDRWDALLGEAHAKAFTVAGATKASLLNDLQGAVTAALENGESIGQFRARFDQIVARHGWSYKGERGWRTRVIYDTNLRTAHMAGRWKQIEQNKKYRPYLVYMTAGDKRVREAHQSWHQLAALVDDPFWTTHYPPNGWGPCRCYVISATQKQIERMGVEVVSNPGVERTERINTSTGEVYGKVPIGIDTGWDYNVGKAWLGPDIDFGQKLMRLPDTAQRSALSSIDRPALNRSWQSWLKQVDAAANPQGYAHTVGFLDEATLQVLKARNVTPANAVIIVYDKQTQHLRGAHKGSSKAIPEAWLQNLPEHLANYQAVLLHKASGNLVFVLSNAGDKSGRAVVAMDFKRKGHVFNSLRSLGIVSLNNLKQADYELLVGSLE